MGFFPYFPSTSLSHSSWEDFTACPLRYAFGTFVAHQGMRASFEHHPSVRVAATLRRISNSYGWAGALNHELFEGMLYAQIDRENGLSNVPTLEDLEKEHWSRFNREWNESRLYNMNSFYEALQVYSAKKAEGAAMPVWFETHARPHYSGTLLTTAEDDKRREEIREFSETSVKRLLRKYRQYIHDTPVRQWFVIEGRELESQGKIHGLVKGFEADKQAIGRSGRAMPYIELSIDGRIFPLFCTFDFAFFRDSLRKKLVIVDLKTTKKIKDTFQEQLEQYALFATRLWPHLRAEDIELRVINPYLDVVQPYSVSQERLLAVEARTVERAKKILSCLVPITDPRVTLEQLYQFFPRRDCVKWWTIGEFVRRGVWPTRRPKFLELSNDREDDVPSMGEAVIFLKHCLSPEEFLRAFSVPHEEATGLIETATATASCGGIRAEKEAVNTLLLRTLVPSMSELDFFQKFEARAFEIALSQADFFPPTTALENPHYCQWCRMLSLCDPGQAVQEVGFWKGKKKSS